MISAARRKSNDATVNSRDTSSDEGALQNTYGASREDAANTDHRCSATEISAKRAKKLSEASIGARIQALHILDDDSADLVCNVFESIHDRFQMVVNFRANNERDGVLSVQEKLLAAIIVKLIRLLFEPYHLLGQAIETRRLPAQRAQKRNRVHVSLAARTMTSPISCMCRSTLTATAGRWSKVSDEPLEREREPIERVRAALVGRRNSTAVRALPSRSRQDVNRRGAAASPHGRRCRRSR
jgi:hypothetical protein